MNGSRPALAAGRRRSGASVPARTVMQVLSLALGAGLLAACSAPASYAVKVHFLERMAREGVQAHNLIVSAGGVSTLKGCTGAYRALQDQRPPDDLGDGVGPSPAFLGEIKVFYVQSCITGLPKQVPGQAPPRSGTPAPSGSASG